MSTKYKTGDWVIMYWDINGGIWGLMYITGLSTYTDSFTYEKQQSYDVILVYDSGEDESPSIAYSLRVYDVDNDPNFSLAFDPPVPSSIKKCTCELFSLMNIGCKCGGE